MPGTALITDVITPAAEDIIPEAALSAASVIRDLSSASMPSLSKRRSIGIRVVFK